jgi:hypothetical protein
VHATPSPPPVSLAPATDTRGEETAATLVYEVEAALDPAIVADYDAWLPGHVDTVLASPGFLSAELLRPAEVQADGRIRRISRYRVRNRAALDHYLEQLAPALRQDGVSRFGDRASYSRRELAVAAAREPAGMHPDCANCGARLNGPFCGQCGQHARESARSVGTLFHDAWHVLTHVDGRFWQTLRRLAFSPGTLTSEYFRERRARYIPPFRLYLVLSLVFFGLASLTSNFEQAAIQVGGTEAAGRGGSSGAEDCTSLTAEPAWLQPALRRICERSAQDGGRALAETFISNIPKMMFVFLPLMAALMLLLYRRPRRYYVEHLVFYLHVHAALFLALTATIAVGALVRGATGGDLTSRPASFALLLYAGWYVWRAMRVHYGDGRALTLAKFAAIFFVYVMFLAYTLAGTALVSALVS